MPKTSPITGFLVIGCAVKTTNAVHVYHTIDFLFLKLTSQTKDRKVF